MGPLYEQHKNALVACLEVVLMSKGNTQYNLLAAKLNSLYDCTISDCYDHPDYLKPILKEVYKEDYNPIIEQIKLHLEDLVNEEDMTNFFEIMES